MALLFSLISILILTFSFGFQKIPSHRSLSKTLLRIDIFGLGPPEVAIIAAAAGSVVLSVLIAYPQVLANSLILNVVFSLGLIKLCSASKTKVKESKKYQTMN